MAPLEILNVLACTKAINIQGYAALEKRETQVDLV